MAGKIVEVKSIQTSYISNPNKQCEIALQIIVN